MRRYVLTHLAPTGAVIALLSLAAVAPSHAQQAASTPANDEIYLDEPEPTPPPVAMGTVKLTEKYEGGATRLEREVIKLSDDQAVNHGMYTEYYANGQKFAEGGYVNGVHDGQWSFWHENGQLCKTVTFQGGHADGGWEIFRSDGTLSGKRSFKDNLRDGTWVSYYEDGKTPKIEDAYAGGQHEGVSRVYFANGKLQREIPFKNGLYDGLMTEWDESGRKIAEINFKANKRDGKFILYRADGTAVEQTYQDGRLVSEPTGG